jgi:hypothetical protein
MFLKPRKASTDPRLRSLLQKAVRRGFARVVEQVARRLEAIGDTTWLRSRTVVITFEEVWPLGGKLEVVREFMSKLDALLAAARSVKQKDAAGLGALAHAYREGDVSMLPFVPNPRGLKIVAESLARPQEFFAWARAEAQSEAALGVVAKAQNYLAAATWEWDKACILAGAYLAIDTHFPVLPSERVASEAEFPYWAALDKHTDEGKVAIKEVAKQIKTSYRHLLWVSFYYESATVNELSPSPWFDAERSWRLGRVGLSSDEATDLWSRAKPALRSRLEPEADALRSLTQEPLPLNGKAQESLF